MPSRPAHALPFLLTGAFQSLVDRLHEELSEQGHASARPVHGFALQAIGAEGATTAEVARRLGVSKQAAAKTVAALVALGYAERGRDPEDGRARPVMVTARGRDLLGRSATTFAALRRRLVRELGAPQVAALEDGLEALAGWSGRGRSLDLPGWLDGSATPRSDARRS